MLTCVGYVWDLYLQSIYILHHFAEQFWSLAKAADFTLRRCRPPSDLGARSQATRFHRSFSWDQVRQGDIYIYICMYVCMYVINYVRRQQFLFSPNRLTCMGFVLLSKGCIPGPHDFASVSGLASHSWCLGPHEVTLVSPFTPALHALGRMSLHVSPPCLPLWVPWAA